MIKDYITQDRIILFRRFLCDYTEKLFQLNNISSVVMIRIESKWLTSIFFLWELKEK